ncbi:hypothetical protein H5410_001044 [Solanum commersonii]|uniref:Uncharacterized protein n=1 Tax=Solanum commersonii TaxID=4109 RepID=A0A9J6AZ20_SOLCO|nr:hypothetical protein H5410_001044 [Solanum commersonii]
MIDEVYKDNETLKAMMMQHAIDHNYTLNKTSINEHTCPLKDHVYCQRQATNNLVEGIIKPELVNHKRKLTTKDKQDVVRLDLGVDVSYAVT